MQAINFRNVDFFLLLHIFSVGHDPLTQWSFTIYHQPPPSICFNQNDKGCPIDRRLILLFCFCLFILFVFGRQEIIISVELAFEVWYSLVL